MVPIVMASFMMWDKKECNNQIEKKIENVNVHTMNNEYMKIFY